MGFFTNIKKVGRQLQFLDCLSNFLSTFFQLFQEKRWP